MKIKSALNNSAQPDQNEPTNKVKQQATRRHSMKESHHGHKTVPGSKRSSTTFLSDQERDRP